MDPNVLREHIWRLHLASLRPKRNIRSLPYRFEFSYEYPIVFLSFALGRAAARRRRPMTYKSKRVCSSFESWLAEKGLRETGRPPLAHERPAP